MKKIFNLGITLAFLLASCAKQEVQNEILENTHQVSFNVSTFEKDISNFPKQSSGKTMSAPNTLAVVSGSDLKTHIKSISYLVFNEKGVKVADVIQKDTEKDFGKINLQLRDGAYKLMVAGGTGTFSGTPSALFLHNISHLSEQFYKQVDFKVESKDANYDATLNRMGAKLVIKLTQEWPSAVKNVTFKANVSNRLNFATLKGENSFGTAYPAYIFGEVAANRLQESCWFSAMFPSETTLQTGILTAYGANNEVLYQRTLENIQLEHNKITTMTGDLFTAKTSGFEIKIDADWGGNINQTF